MNIPNNSKILFIGDSITDCGRDASGEVCPWLPSFGLGQGYVSMIYGWLGAAYPEAGLRILNKGVSGNTVSDLAERWEEDVLAHRPDVLCVMIGINDVWRQFDCPLRPEVSVGPEEYRRTLENLVSTSKDQGAAIYLASPFFIETNRADAMRGRMDEYGAIVKEMATRFEVPFLDVQEAIDSVLAHVHSSSVAWDRIHPSPVGHMAIARTFLKAFGCL
jgi:lysophospholipase L1-like esterase